MTLLFLAVVWAIVAAFTLTLFAAAKAADRRTEAMLQEVRVPRHSSHRQAA